MYDIYAVLITVGCFAFTYVLIRVLGRVWWAQQTLSGWSSRSWSPRTWSTPCSEGSGS